MLSRFAQSVVAGLTAVGATFGSVSSTAATTPDGGDVEQMLAVVNAGGGTFTETDSGYLLTLTDIVPRVIWFVDRPARGTGTMPIDELVDVFFGSDPPNAALEVFSDPAAGTVVIVELMNPRYDSDQGILELDARVLADEQIPPISLRDHRARVSGDVPSEFGAAALFLDDVCTSGDRVTLDPVNITCADALTVFAAWQAAGSPGRDGTPGTFSSGETQWIVEPEDGEPGLYLLLRFAPHEDFRTYFMAAIFS